MRELTLTSGLRVFLGTIGVVAAGAGLAVGVAQLRSATRGASTWSSGILVALVCAVIVLGGMRVLQGSGAVGSPCATPRDAAHGAGEARDAHR